MIPPGSETTRPLGVPSAVVLTLAGVVAMFGSTWLALHLGLGLGVRGLLALGTALLALPALVAVAARAVAWPAVLGRGRVTRRTILFSFCLSIALWVTSIGIVEVQSLFRPPTEAELAVFRRLLEALRPSGPADLALSILVIAILPALCEEFVFRGVLLTSLARWLGSSAAVLLTAAAFGLVHFDPVRPVFAFVLGLALGILRVRSDSLTHTAVVHGAFNALTLFIAPLVDDPSTPYTPEPGLGLACLVAGVALSVPLLRALGRAPVPPD
jgi:membrane protease YdiL (CAAX protease family)